MDLGPLGKFPSRQQKAKAACKTDPHTGMKLSNLSAFGTLGLPSGTGVKSLPASAKDSRDAGVTPRVWKTP